MVVFVGDACGGCDGIEATTAVAAGRLIGGNKNHEDPTKNQIKIWHSNFFFFNCNLINPVR